MIIVESISRKVQKMLNWKVIGPDGLQGLFTEL